MFRLKLYAKYLKDTGTLSMTKTDKIRWRKNSKKTISYRG